MSDNKTIRWGILGCGDVARRRVVGAIAEDPASELLAVCRRNAAALEQFCSDFGVVRGYTDEADLIGDPDIDAVYIATPVDRHLPQTLACAAAGKHVPRQDALSRAGPARSARPSLPALVHARMLPSPGHQ